MAELTSLGYIRKRLSEYLDQLRAGWKSIFGDNIDVSNDSQDGQLIGITAEEYSDLDQALEDVYNAFDPQAAGGSSLSKLVLINGLTRKESTNTTAAVTLVGTNGVTVPAGSIIKTSDTGESFTLDSSVLLTGGSDAGAVTAVDTGAISAVAGTLTEIATPIAGWSTVTNAGDATVGQDEETDEELRIRRDRSTSISAKSIVDGIFGSLSALDDVTGVVVLENATGSDQAANLLLTFAADFVSLNTIDMDINGAAISTVTFTASHTNTINLLEAAILAVAGGGLIASVIGSDLAPGSDYVIVGETGVTVTITNIVVALGTSQSSHTLVTGQAPILSHGINAIVDGGDDAEIAETIFDTKSAGCQTTGEITEFVIDDQGGSNSISFNRPVDTEIDITVDVTVDTSLFPSNGDQQIKDALVAFGAASLNVGDDVIYSRLYTPINSIPGHSVTDLQIAKTGETPGTSDILIAVVEIAKILDGNITVNVT